MKKYTLFWVIVEKTPVPSPPCVERLLAPLVSVFSVDCRGWNASDRLVKNRRIPPHFVLPGNIFIIPNLTKLTWPNPGIAMQDKGEFSIVMHCVRCTIPPQTWGGIVQHLHVCQLLRIHPAREGGILHCHALCSLYNAPSNHRGYSTTKTCALTFEGV